VAVQFTPTGALPAGEANGGFLMPNVRVEAGPTARRQARAGENVRVPPARAWWLAVGPRLERGVRRLSRQCALLSSLAETPPSRAELRSS
jgi:hypothetical protein